MRAALALVAAFAALAAGTSGARAATPCPAPSFTPNPATVAIAAPAATLKLRVANTFATREYGLMCVRALVPHTGMIFAFAGGDRSESFWMKNTLIPLDMIWVLHDGKVSSVEANVPSTTPDTPTIDIPQRLGVGSYVIELAAGEAATDGITPGTHLDLTHIPHAKE